MINIYVNTTQFNVDIFIIDIFLFSLVEGNLVSAKRTSYIPANQEVHIAIEFDCKH
jgi:hypothetical protein